MRGYLASIARLFRRFSPSAVRDRAQSDYDILEGLEPEPIDEEQIVDVREKEEELGLLRQATCIKCGSRYFPLVHYTQREGRRLSVTIVECLKCRYSTFLVYRYPSAYDPKDDPAFRAASE